MDHYIRKVMETGSMRMKKNKKKKYPHLEEKAQVKFGKGGKSLAKKPKPKKSFSLGQKPKKTMDYGGELFKVENWLPD